MLVVICGAYEFVQGSVCSDRDFRMHPEQASNDCIIDICNEGVFRPHDCTLLQRDSRCNEEDLKYNNRRQACDCCHLPPQMIDIPLFKIQDMHP